MPTPHEVAASAKDRAMTVGNGINAAATLAAGDIDTFFAIVDGVVEKAIETQALYAIKEEFGAGVIEATEAPVPAAPQNGYEQQTAHPSYPQAAQVQQAAVQQAVAQQSTPPAIPGATQGDSSKDALWREFFADPTAWYDNRGSKPKPTSPDFTRKVKLQGQQYRDGLWLAGRFPNPQWVNDQLRAMGYLQ